MFDALERLRINWSDFAEASKVSADLARSLTSNKSFLMELVARAGDEPGLLALSEKHLLLDYLVIYDALDRGFRIRINMGSGHPAAWAHDHRFSFSTCLLSGSYLHTIFARSSSSDSSTVLAALVIREETVGSCFSLHHSAIHSTEKRAEMTSVFVRGPSEKAISNAYDSGAGINWERRGGQASSNPVETRSKMVDADYRSFCDNLRAFGVISK